MPDDVGSLGEEATRLAGAVAGWARGEGAGRWSETVGHMATGDPACCVCPVCAVIVVLRGERPELTGRLVESLTGLVAAGQGLLDTLTAVTTETRAGAAPRADASGPPSPPDRTPPRVQQIPLDDEPPPDPTGEPVGPDGRDLTEGR